MKRAIPVLYSFRRCPYAMRARMAIAYSKQTVTLREVVLKIKPPSLFTYSHKGTVPVLVLEDGTVIDESIDIMYWALKIQDRDRWLENLEEQIKLIKINDHSFKALLDKYKYADRHPEHSEQCHREACYPFLDHLEALLEKQNFLFSDQYGFADIAIFPFIRQFAHVDLAWFESSSWTKLQHWLTQLKTSELFTSVMTKYPAWTEGDDPVYFPE